LNLGVEIARSPINVSGLHASRLAPPPLVNLFKD
jgi:hypothetical protein